MKIKMKMIAAAVAMVAAGAANAAWEAGNVSNGSLGLIVWDTVSGSYYARGTNFNINNFLPNDADPITGNSEPGPPVFDKTPEAGLTINASTPGSGFGTEPGFATWLATVNQANVRWFVVGNDTQSLAGTANTARQIVSIAEGASFTIPSNGNLVNNQAAINGFQHTGANLTGTVNPGQRAALEANITGPVSLNNALSTAFDGVQNLYYWTRTVGTGSQATTANSIAYGNSAGLARVTLSAAGDLSYVLNPAGVAEVPLPAAAWLMGAGLLALGGAARRKQGLKAD